jgi:membrane-bound lytic murein transglycosylase A
MTLPDGAIAYLSTKKPVMNLDGKIVNWTQLNRFVFPQDSGAAIKGAGRVDLFWGHGYYAELAASHMKAEGKLYFLVKKQKK